MIISLNLDIYKQEKQSSANQILSHYLYNNNNNDDNSDNNDNNNINNNNNLNVTD